MANSAVRFFFAATGILILGSWLMNGWIHKELETPLNIEPPSFVVIPREEPPEEKVEDEYEIEDPDFKPYTQPGPYQTGVKPKKRVLDEKIIYEMPTSNKFLIQ